MAEYIDITSLMNHIETQTRKWVLIKNAFDKILRENDTMREQLSSIGKRLGDNMDDVQPVVRGRWEKVGGFVTPGGDPVWQCSECQKGRHVYGTEHGTYGASVSDGQWVSCPNCGADMRGRQSG